MRPDRRHETARIYQFPVTARRPSEATRGAATVIEERHSVATADFSGGWYHDAAIKNEAPRPDAG